MPTPLALDAATRLRRHALPVLAAMTLALTAATALPSFAQDAPAAPDTTTQAPAEAPAAPQPGDVLARVDGVEITEADLAFAAEDLAQELQAIPPAERRAFLLTVLIDMKVMANAARENGLDQTELFARRLDYLEERALRRAFFAENIEAEITEEQLQAAYDELIVDFEAQPEVNARHILVETEEEAQEIRAEIEAGTSFADAAAEHSLDGSGQNGGDLGYFSAGMMVEEFEQAAFALEVGELSQPVQSQFGWHLIQLEDRRVSEPPALDQLRQQLSQQVLYQNFADVVNGLKEATEIEIDDPALAAAVEAQGSM
jgi:peptidyl-prolyl cis-trans isomerase C